MINVSSEFLELMQTRHDFYEYADITLRNGTILYLEPKDFTTKNNSITDGSGGSSLPLGLALEKNIALEIMNDRDQFSEYDFFGAKIRLYLKFHLSQTVETIEKGEYTVLDPETPGTVITITAVDDMYRADKSYDTNLIYPATINQILMDACSKCDISLILPDLDIFSTVIQEKPVDLTYRQVIGYCAMFAAGNARVDVDNYLRIIQYNSSYVKAQHLDGGYFDSSTPYASGDSADGGTMNPWNRGDSYIGGSFSDFDMHDLGSFKNLTVDTDDIDITGIQISYTNENNEEITYLNGSEGYVIEISNPLFSGIEEQMIDYIAAKLVDLRFRKFSGDHISDPTIEAFDIVYVRDRKGNIYPSFVTDVTFNFFGYTNLSNNSASIVKNRSKFSSEASRTLTAAKKLFEKEKTEREQAVNNLSQALASSSGMFSTEVQQNDGSVISYLHDKPTLSTSQTIVKITSEAVGISNDGGQTYPYGFILTGELITRLLYAEGIDADYITTGAIEVKDSNGNVVFSADIDTGNVLIKSESIVMGGGTSLDDDLIGIKESVDNVGTAAGAAQGEADNLSKRVSDAELLIDSIRATIATLVTDSNGTSLMQQTSQGWTYSTSAIQASVSALQENLKTLSDVLGGTNNTVSNLEKDISELQETAEYVRIGSFNGEPCIELGESDSDYRLLITNTKIVFYVGSEGQTYIDTNGLFTRNLTISGSLTHGSWLWAGDDTSYGLSWVG